MKMELLLQQKPSFPLSWLLPAVSELLTGGKQQGRPAASPPLLAVGLRLWLELSDPHTHSLLVPFPEVTTQWPWRLSSAQACASSLPTETMEKQSLFELHTENISCSR